MPTPCFWTEPSGDVEVALRRYSDRSSCPLGVAYHNARVGLGRAPEVLAGDGISLASIDETVPRWDRRWPASCPCGYRFDYHEDRWQVNQEPYHRAADGREWLARNLPPGAMYDARWSKWRGPDGVALVVVLPCGPWAPDVDTRGWHWNVDGPSSPPEGSRTMGPPWTRSGDPLAVPPSVTARPSINAVGRYHGYLQAGVLTDG